MNSEKTKVFINKLSSNYCLNELFDLNFINIMRQSPQPINEFVKYSGSNGARFLESSFDSFVFNLSFSIAAKTKDDLILQISSLYSFIYDDDKYYINYSKEPGKRFKVKPRPWEEESRGAYKKVIKIDFDVYEGHAESLFTTLSSEGFNDNIFQFGQGLPTEDYQYQHNKNNFIIYNAGDFTVDPREHELIIAIKGVSEGAVNVFNKTTGERFIYNGSLYSTKGEVLTVDGVYPKKNGVNCGIETNGGLITLVPGENEIQISNLSRTEVSFDFRFLYK